MGSELIPATELRFEEAQGLHIQLLIHGNPLRSPSQSNKFGVFYVKQLQGKSGELARLCTVFTSLLFNTTLLAAEFHLLITFCLFTLVRAMVISRVFLEPSGFNSSRLAVLSRVPSPLHSFCPKDKHCAIRSRT